MFVSVVGPIRTLGIPKKGGLFWGVRGSRIIISWNTQVKPFLGKAFTKRRNLSRLYLQAQDQDDSFITFASCRRSGYYKAI